jgi:hypothetical protein
MTGTHLPLRLLYAGSALLALGCALPAQGLGIVEQKVTAFDMAAGDIFGAAVALDGNLALVCNEWDDDNGTDSGSIYAYHWDGTAWQFDQKLDPADNQAGDNFGRAVFMQGNLAIVSSHWDDDNGFHSGSAYVYEHDGSQWIEQQKLLPSDGQANDNFGNSLSFDGEWLAIGADREDQGGNNAGAIYIFRDTGSAWVQTQKLLAPDAASLDFFGRCVSVSGDWAVIGAWKEDQGGADAGAAYAFRYNGREWVFEQKLMAFDAAPGDLYGWATYVQDDVAVVSSYHDDDHGSDSGSVYVYRLDGLTWVFEQKLHAADAAAGGWFGYSLSISGNRLAVAATGTGSGYAYMFRYDGTQWVERQKLTPSDGANQDKFGFQLAISGGTVLSGAWRDADAGPDTGSAYFYHCTSLLPPPSPFGLIQRFGQSFGFGPYPSPGTLPQSPAGMASRAAPACW